MTFQAVFSCSWTVRFFFNFILLVFNGVWQYFLFRFTVIYIQDYSCTLICKLQDSCQVGGLICFDKGKFSDWYKNGFNIKVTEISSQFWSNIWHLWWLNNAKILFSFLIIFLMVLVILSWYSYVTFSNLVLESPSSVKI